MLQKIVQGNPKNARDVGLRGQNTFSKKSTLKFLPQAGYIQYRSLSGFY